MVYYIIATRKSGKTESEITHYMYNTDKSSRGWIVEKQPFRNAININVDSFYSYNIDRGTLVNCEWYKSSKGESFLKSDPNGTEKDNLLELPNC